MMGVTLWGSPEKGPYGGIQKFPEEFEAYVRGSKSPVMAAV